LLFSRVGSWHEHRESRGKNIVVRNLAARSVVVSTVEGSRFSFLKKKNAESNKAELDNDDSIESDETVGGQEHATEEMVACAFVLAGKTDTIRHISH
jgi:hypothetical protein